jgi:hypothetical protein
MILGNSGIFSEKKTGSVPELPEPLWLLFADEIIDLKMFRNASRIVLVGTGIILRPTKIFSDLTVAKNGFMNSKTAFWLLYGKPLFWVCSKDLGGGLQGKESLLGGPH